MSNEPVAGPEVSAEDGPSGVEAREPTESAAIFRLLRLGYVLHHAGPPAFRIVPLPHAAGRTTHEPEEGQKR
jgi:hypothetical protein